MQETASNTGAYLRSLGGLTFSVTVSESEKYSAKLTDYPIEDGATISDHVILQPHEVTVKIGQGVDGSETDPRDMLDKLKKLMEKREPFEVYTGKSYFPSMVITSIQQTTDSKSETVLLASVTLREVVIAETQAAAVPVIRQKQPKKTAASVKRGTQQLQEKPTENGQNANDYTAAARLKERLGGTVYSN